MKVWSAVTHPHIYNGVSGSRVVADGITTGTEISSAHSLVDSNPNLELHGNILTQKGCFDWNLKATWKNNAVEVLFKQLL